MTSLRDFIAARLEEDRAIAQAAIDDLYGEDDCWFDTSNEHIGSHYRHHQPSRVLREVTAKRAILIDIVSAMNGMDQQINGEWGIGPMDPADYESVALLQLLALPYSDHPAYRKEWAA